VFVCVCVCVCALWQWISSMVLVTGGWVRGGCELLCHNIWVFPTCLTNYSCTKSKHNRYTVSYLHVSTLLTCRQQGILTLTQAAPPNWFIVYSTGAYQFKLKRSITSWSVRMLGTKEWVFLSSVCAVSMDTAYTEPNTTQIRSQFWRSDVHVRLLWTE
jgi:hypothetical protein